MKKILLLSFICLVASTNSFAQIIQIHSETKETFYIKPEVQKTKSYPRYQGEFNVGYITPSVTGMLETIHGIRVNKYLFAGLGIGFRYSETMTFSSHDYTIDGVDLAYLPIYANIKGYYPITNKIEPFLNLSLGYAADISGQESSGFYCDFGTGIRLWKFAVGLGIIHQSFSVDGGGETWAWKNTGFYLKLGFQW